MDPFQAITRPPANNVPPLGVHVIPSGDDAIASVPTPTATHKDPFQAEKNA